MTPETLANEWLDLFNTNIGKAISNKDFMHKYIEIDKQLKQLPDEDQQLFKALIHKGVKKSLAPKQWRETV